ncbi:hypothetical protein V2J09_016802, partial [Rumex salicifolius]
NSEILRSFLGLANYYWRFINNYSIITKPLTTLLQKDGFTWLPAADEAFVALKTTLTLAPVLALPDFEKVFIVETDASNHGIGVNSRPQTPSSIGVDGCCARCTEIDLLSDSLAVHNSNRLEISQMLALTVSTTLFRGELRRQVKLVIGSDLDVKLHIFKRLHDSAIGGHLGRNTTLKRIKSLFYWAGMSVEL